ncbi:DUF641 domain-containing protein [Cephalotus follicularis]|uniref:DUF641 domain-containing protein n=1 Tax=Cephalotus follicularis TaxID=3775 RepID=A0A1Q3AYR2_CEPFO|nr:DUF641 domain-containing protein [Cephalotus follicularis]
MDSVRPSSVTQKKSKLARTLAKFLHIRAATGIAPVKGIQKVKSQEMVKDDQKTVRSTKTLSQAFMNTSDDEELQNRMALEALLLKLFSTISSVKAAYAQLQFAQSPYDVDGIQASDGLVVSELKNLSELKQCFLKKQFDFSPEKTMVSAEIQELKSRLKMYEILGKKLESQLRLKDSEITFLREKLEDFNKQNKLVDKRLNQSGQLYVLENVHISGLNPSHFNTFLRHTVKGIRSFVRLIVDEMKSACWDIDMAASSIEPGVVYWRADDKCFAFESFVCREMFDSFQYPNFYLQNESLPPTKQQRKLFFERFLELKSIKAKQFLALNPTSTFAKFCRAKYLQLIHPKMESSLFGNLSQRNIVN